jgi:hypothetical protein
MFADDISLSSVSADNTLDLNDGSDDTASGYSNYVSQAMALGSELAFAALTPQPAQPVFAGGGGPFAYPPPPSPAAGISGKNFMLLALGVLALLALWAFFGE